MRRAAFALVALFAMIPAVGCGTIFQNQRLFGSNGSFGLESREQRVYGGVRSDTEFVCTMYSKLIRGVPGAADPVWGYNPDSHSPPDVLIVPYLTLYSPPDVLIVPYLTLYFLVDIPLSFVADTILLPWDVRAQWLRLKSEWEQPKEVPPFSADTSSSLDSLKDNPFNQWQVTRNFEIPPPAPKSQPDSQR